MTEPAQTVDKAELMERFGGDWELIAYIAVEFFDSAEVLLAEIREAIQNGDAKALSRSAHTLKGAVGNFAAKAAHEAALALEMLGREGKFEGAEEAYALLEERLAALAPALDTLSGD
jgi:HPt (histidine-containing phosphotransfer) domain-containing protein